MLGVVNADRRRRRTLALFAAVALAGLVAEPRSARAAAPGSQPEPGAFCTRSSCAGDPAADWSVPFGFAAAALACIGLGRRRAGAPGSPRA